MFNNLDAITRFVAIVDAGTMRLAAERVGVTQAALTRSLKILEQDVGASLFDRHSRALHLTALGHSVLLQARHLLREVQLAETEIRTQQTGERGLIRLAAAPVWISTILPNIIPRLHEAFPALTIDLDAQNYEDALPLLKNGDYDAFFGGFKKLESIPSFLVRRPMFPARLVVVARKGHPLLKKDTVTAHDLLNSAWVSFQSEIAYLDTLNLVVHQQTGETISSAIKCDSMLPALELLRHGDYISLLPSSFLLSTYGAGLATIQPDIDQISFDSGPIYRRSLDNNRAFGMLLQLAKDRVTELGFAAS